MKAAIYTYFLQCRYLHIPHVSPKKDFYCLKHGLVFQKTRPVCIIGFSKKLNKRKTAVTVIGLCASVWVRLSHSTFRSNN